MFGNKSHSRNDQGLKTESKTDFAYARHDDYEKQ